MRASRLVALLLTLQRRGGATAEELAEELEVSVRTIYRDVAALQATGAPLWTETGPGGGIRLVEGWRTTLDGMTADEAAVLFLAGAPDAINELGLGTLLTAAQSKVMSTLPPELRGRVARVRERFHVDAPGWFHQHDPLPHLDAVAGAVWDGRRLDLRYGRPPGTRRRVDPLGLVLKAGVWYLVALHRGAPRSYRVSRILAAEVRDERVARPDDFDLVAYWDASTAEFSASMLRARIRIRVDEHAAAVLPHLVDRKAALDALATARPVDDGPWREIDLAVESVDVALTQLLGLGAGVEVIEPLELRRRFAEVGAAMAERNATPGPGRHAGAVSAAQGAPGPAATPS